MDDKRKPTYVFEDTGQIRPACINHGCTRPVTISSKSSSGVRTTRLVCGPCHLTYKPGVPYTKGVTPFKKDFCENINGNLGWICTTTIYGTHQLDLDHINGDHSNNTHSNVQTICKCCHSHKSKIEGDHKNNKVSSNIHLTYRTSP